MLLRMFGLFLVCAMTMALVMPLFLPASQVRMADEHDLVELAPYLDLAMVDSSDGPFLARQGWEVGDTILFENVKVRRFFRSNEGVVIVLQQVAADVQVGDVSAVVSWLQEMSFGKTKLTVIGIDGSAMAAVQLGLALQSSVITFSGKAMMAGNIVDRWLSRGLNIRHLALASGGFRHATVDGENLLGLPVGITLMLNVDQSIEVRPVGWVLHG